MVHYIKLGSAHSKPTNGFVASFEQIEEIMFCWHSTKEELNHWFESKEREFAEKGNKSPRLSTEDWLQKYIYTDLHMIFFATYGNKLYDWLSKLTGQDIFKK